MIDLRSDTVTKPTAGMRAAIAAAEVGDDMSAEDPTVNALEARVAELLGMEAAVYNCSGTQSNQMAVRAHCQSGDELLIEETGHIANYEAGGPAILSAVTCRTIRGKDGLLDVSDLEGRIRAENQHFCTTRLVCVENSTNMGGGRVYPLAQLKRVCDWAHANRLQVHMDGARLFNACLAGGYSLREVGSLVDSVSICFSKGLGCPMGSILVGRKELIHKARRARKVFGGALRQAGMVAAAAHYALDHHVDRLQDDHANARRLADRLAKIDGVTIDPTRVETNLVFFEIDPAWGTAAQLSAALREQGVRINPSSGPQRLRACTHLDVDAAAVDAAADVVARVLASSRRGDEQATRSSNADGPYAASR